jgi:hypothetical protein
MEILKRRIRVTVCIAGVLSLTLPATADCPVGWAPVGPGPKIGGPNRSILTAGGYGAAKGSFSRIGATKLYLPKNGDGQLTNPHGNKPTFYLGASGSGFAIDAGAQYEPLKVRGIDPGWIRFLRVTVGSCSKWLPNEGTNPRQTDLTNVSTEFELTRDGIATLKMWASNPLTSDPLVCDLKEATTATTLNVTSMQMKRNIGLTQSAGFSIDGSYVLQTEFSGGQVRQWNQVNGQWTLGSYENWPNASTTTNTQSGKSPLGQRWIDCEPPWKRLPDGAEQSPTAHSPSRFVQEAVNIDLRGKKLNKKPLKKGK